ncbi:insulin-like growth factor-binding protein-related protein 1 [Nephila pilipes]|uniref:Insulin-like growth factor-binding protein-related protein 1 n=1 Tax=Nephila pilipes TaxID=299642 RepID=A0A8X6J7W2_NEPPI|nr:insulin-like growth factor-binding protein-related protein 1 [Nephila pilipes]
MHHLLALTIGCFAVSVILFHEAYGQVNRQCGECNSNSCETPRNCLTGLVKDSCDCCYSCAKREGERCAHASLPFGGLGRCGENLECRVRNDLDRNDPPEAVCFCVHQQHVCGSDGITYDNICQLTEARYSRRDGLRVVSSEPCRKSPHIVSSPQNISNTTGSYAILTCEARAWPLPTIRWERTRDGSLTKLPGNNTRLTVHSRNGPNTDEATSWLLFLRLSKEDSGTYICKADNDVGSATTSATVQVID